MGELKKLLVALIRGQGSFEQVNAAFDRVLEDSPERRGDAAKLLKAARDAGLPHHLFVALSGKLETAPGTASSAAAAPDSPSRPPPPPPPEDEERTVVLDDGPKAASDPDATVLATPDDDADATVFAGGDDGDATEVNAPDEEEATLVNEEPRDDATMVNADADNDDATVVDAGAGNDDATVVDAAPGDDSTVVNAGPATDDATVVNAAPDNDSTVVNAGGDPDQTVVSGPDGDQGFDILDEDAIAAAETSAKTGASWPTAVEATARSGAGITREFREGDRLRNRYELISKLGEGGMGAVWKGKDLLKEEARDRNPYVAIKLLQGDFKEHPEAFIALQREAAKQQRLAHPNIATVFDFDRDDHTQTVFMTMEVMEGTPMDAYIRKLPAGGLPFDEALPLIEQLSAGLNYAHQAGLVHSDLKPGNAFLTKESNVKLLDFGIARASKTKTDAEGETTLFDPGTLGALTPTYATIEMFEGQDPDPRDDIYALAIMAYQFLTSKHPYGKKSAPKAKELGLKVEPVPGLTKRQNRALARGLAFHREDRTPSVEAFLEEIRPRKSRAPLIVGVGSFLVIAIAGLSFNPVMDFIAKGKREDVIAIIQKPGLSNIKNGLEAAKSLGDQQMGLVLDDERTIDAVVRYLVQGGEQTINETLGFLASYPPKWAQDVRNQDPARKAIVDLYEGKIYEAFDTEKNRFDYQSAQQYVARLDQLYPDSATVLQIRNALNSQRESKLKELGDKYTAYIEEGRLLPVEGQEDIGDVLAVVRQVDPEHRLISDNRLRLRFGTLAEQAIKDQDYERAKSVLAASTTYAPDDPQLRNLRFQVESELQRIANEKRVAEIEQRLQGQIASLTSLSDFQAVRDDLLVLSDLSPTSPVLSQIQDNLKRAFDADLRSTIQAKSWDAGEALLVGFAKLLEIPYLIQQRTALSRAEAAAGFVVAMTPERTSAIADRVSSIEDLLAKPEFTSDWEIKLRVPYKELIALVPEGDASFEKVRNSTARLYLKKAQEARQGELFAEAKILLEKGEVFYPGLKNFADERIELAKAEDVARKRREEELRLARIEALKNDFRDSAKSEDVQRGRDILDKLAREGVDKSDPFIADEAPQLLASAYFRLAQPIAEQARTATDFAAWKQTQDLAVAGLSFRPEHPELTDLAKSAEAELAKGALVQELNELFDSLKAIDVAATLGKVEQVKGAFPSNYASYRTGWAKQRGERIRGLANSKDLKVADLADRLAEYRRVFPDEHGNLLASVSGVVEKRIQSIDAADAKQVSAVKQALADYKGVSEKGHAALVDALARDVAQAVKALEKKDKFAAKELQTAGLASLGNVAALSSITIVLPIAEIAQGMELLKAGKLTAAAQSLDAAKKKKSDHPDIPALEKPLTDAMTLARNQYAKYAEAANAEEPTSSSSQAQAQKKYDDVFASIQGMWNDNPEFKQIEIERAVKGACRSSLAGYGSKASGECWDTLGRKKGPPLVVVPAGGGNAKPFAISKFEISGEDYNEYCKATKACKTISRREAKLPLTGISVQDAETFAKWLSEQASESTGRKVVYRLPTDGEWEHAAKAGGGAQPDTGTLNCRVTAGGNIIKGHALVSAESGSPNAWGLSNYIGNAQELVRSGSGVVARGGAFEDPLTKCDPSISRSHNGQPDETTGFRLVRELG